MFSWLVGGGTTHRPKSKENQITEVVNGYVGTQRFPNGLKVPFTLPGIGQVDLEISWAYDFPTSCPQLKFIGRGTMQHPLVEEGGVISHTLPCLSQWGPRSDLGSVVRIVIDDMRTRNPTVYFPNEKPIVVSKEPGTPLGCVFADATLELTKITPGSAAEKAYLTPFIGKRLLHLNNTPVRSIADISQKSRDPYLVLSFEEPTPAAYPACPQSTLPAAQYQPPPAFTLPPIPQDFNLEAMTTAELQTLTTDPAALQSHFESHPFAVECKAIKESKQTEAATTKSELMSLNTKLLQVAVTKEAARSQQEALTRELEPLKAKAVAIKAQTTREGLLGVLKDAIDKAEKESEKLEQEIAGGATKEEEYRKVRLQYHLCLEKQRSLEVEG